jgi:hypothetical protein
MLLEKYSCPIVHYSLLLASIWFSLTFSLYNEHLMSLLQGRLQREMAEARTSEAG